MTPSPRDQLFQISSDRGDQMIFFWFEINFVVLGFFWIEKFWQVFFWAAKLVVIFFCIKNNLKI